MTTARAAILLVLVVGCSRPASPSGASSASASAPAPVASTSAPAPVASTSAPAPVPAVVETTGPYVGVPQRMLGNVPMLFHPTQPLVGQIIDGWCDVWDLDLGVRRGHVLPAECTSWAGPISPLPPDARSLAAPAELASTWSPDGKLVAIGRRGSAEVQLWDAGTGRSLRALPLGPPGHERDAWLKLSGLLWAPDGRLIAIRVVGQGADASVAFLLLDPEGRVPPVDFQLSHFSPDVDDPALKSAYPDPRGRYLGFLMGGCQTDDFTCAGVLSLRDGKVALLSHRADGDDNFLGVKQVDIAWALGGAVVYKAVGPTAGELSQDHDVGTPLLLRRLDLRAGDRRHVDGDGEQGALVRASVAPDGLCAAFSTVRYGSRLLAEDESRRQESYPQVLLWCPLRDVPSPWALDREAADLVWSPSSDAVAVVAEDGGVEVVSAKPSSKPGAPATWSGAKLIVASRDAGVGARGGDPRVDPSRRFQASEDRTDDAVTRLADKEVLHFAGSDAVWTDGYLFSTTPPPEWVFRSGLDVLHGHVIREMEATFLRPTPDLGARFLSGARLPHPYEDPHDRNVPR
jgi:hypothetical protein